MKILRYALAIVWTIVCANAAAPTIVSGWQACDTASKGVPIFQAAGDVITCSLPYSTAKPSRVAFLTTQTSSAVLGNLTGKTVTATFRIDNIGAVVYRGGYSGGCTRPPNLGIYLTTQTGYYSLNDSSNANTCWHHWWAGPSRVDLQDVDGGVVVTVTASLADLSQWSDGLGNAALNRSSLFNSAVSNVHQIGLSFGVGCFYDTGAGMQSGTATLHLLNFTVQ